MISSNLVSNPSFETDQSGWSGLNSTRVRVPCQPAPDGSYAAKVGYSFEGRQNERQYIIGMLDSVVAPTGGCYGATVWVAAASPSTIGDVLVLVIQERRDDGPKTYVEHSYATVQLREDFQVMTRQHTVRNAGDLIDIYVEQGEADRGDAFYLDNASLVFSSC